MLGPLALPAPRRAVGVVLLLATAATLGLTGGERYGLGGWPCQGLAAAFLITVVAPWRPAATLLLAAVTGPVMAWSYNLHPILGATAGLVIAVPALGCATLLAGDRTDPLVMDDTRAQWRYSCIVWGTSLLCGVLAGLGSLWELSATDALLTGLMTTLSAGTGQLVVLPLLFRRTPAPMDSGPVGRWAQRILLAAVLLASFLAETGLSVVFLVLPVLGWCAIRMSRLEAFVQLNVVALMAYVVTFAGAGPLVQVPDQLSERLDPLLFFVFVAACVYVVVPVALTMERLRIVSQQSAEDAHTVEQLLESATSTVFLATDEVGQITRFNVGATRIIGYAAEDVLGRSPQLFHSDEEIARHAAFFGVPPDYASVMLAQATTGITRDWEVIRADGSTRIGSIRLSPILGPSERVIGYIGVGEDVTERYRTHQALATALDREQQAVARLLEVDHVKQELVSNVSHELRTPITSIAGYAELLDELGHLDDDQRDAVRRIARNADRLRLLVEDLLTLSRSEGGELEVEPVDLDLAAVAREAHELLGGFLQERRLDVSLEVPDAPVWIRGDGPALERVVVNLMSNAVKFTPNGGRVVLRVSGAGDCAVLCVADTGIGISEADQQRLFTRFFRSQSATSNAIQGTGLGLSIVQAIVTAHRGTVDVASVLGHGTTVTVRLPLRGGSAEQGPDE